MSPKEAYTSSFAAIYDEIMEPVPYDLWNEYIHEFLSFYGRSPDRVLDLACGTGNMTLRFAQNFKEVTGVDCSADMLEIARKKSIDRADNVNYIEADIRNFVAPRKYMLVVALFDSLNYILEFSQLKKVFSNVYNSLSNDGLFIFDMNTLHRLMKIKPGTTVFNGDSYTCFWQDEVDKKKKRWRVQLKIYFNGRDQEPEIEVHEETSYPYKKVVKALKDVGFSQVDVYRAFTFNQGDDNANRLYYVAGKSGKNLSKKSLLKCFSKKVKWRVKKVFL